jgi:hypothetical protein
MNIEADVVCIHIDIHRKGLLLWWLMYGGLVVAVGHITYIAIMLVPTTQMTVDWLLRVLVLLLERAKV